MLLTVIICSHNPRADYLDQTLAGLKAQTLPAQDWELLLVDNRSDEPLQNRVDLSWHPHARHVPEPQLGLTNARLRGIDEATADLLIFVDDDNILDPDYLECCLAIASKWPMLGAWGGQSRPGFEKSPPDWTRSYWPCIGIVEFKRDRWSNSTHDRYAVPIGAGMCVRQAVARRYAELVRDDPLRRALDRRGANLTSGGDIDMALTACDLGLGTGRFVALGLTHLIPERRLDKTYLLELSEAIGYSATMLAWVRKEFRLPERNRLSLKCSPRRWWRMVRGKWNWNRSRREYRKAYERGRRRAIREVRNFTSSGSSPEPK